MGRNLAKLRLLSCTALCGALLLPGGVAWAGGPIYSETLSYSPEAHPLESPAVTSSADNPYEQRRNQARQKILDELHPAIVASLPPAPTHQPLKITIPNLNAVAQARPALPTLPVRSHANVPERAPSSARVVANAGNTPSKNNSSAIEQLASLFLPEDNEDTPSRKTEAANTPVAPHVITSPGIIVKHEVLRPLSPAMSPQQMAELAPAAGGAAPPAPSANAPLIQTPDITAPPVPVASPSPAATAPSDITPLVNIAAPAPSPAAPPAITAIALPPPTASLQAKPDTAIHAAVPLSQPPAQIMSAKPAVPNTTTPLVEPPASASEKPAIADATVKPATAIAPVNPVAPLVEPPPAPLPSKPAIADALVQPAALVSPEKSVAPLVEPPPSPLLEQPTTAEAKDSPSIPPSESVDPNDHSEPERQLSPESKKILSQIPPMHRHSAKPDKPITVIRATESETPKSGQTTVENAKDAAMGMSIEVKKPKLDMNYTLEEAYNALISGHAEAAITLYKEVLANDPKNTNALFGLATLYHRAGQLDMARPLYARLLAIDPNYRDGMNNFLVLLADEAPQEALTELQQLEQRNPAFSPIPAQMAIIYEKLGDFDKATQKMVLAVDLAPENITYRYNLAIMLDKQKKYEEAAKLYREIVEAWQRGDSIPGDIQKVQERLTFISSNRP